MLVRFQHLDFSYWDAVDTSKPMDYFSFDFTTRIWYKQAIAQQQPTTVQWTDPHYIINSNYTGLTADLALWTRDNRFAGVIGIDFTYMNLASYVGNFKPTPNSFMFIMSGTGLMVVSSFNESLGNATLGTLKRLPECTSPILVQISNYFGSILKPNQSYESLGPVASFQLDNLYVQLALTKHLPSMIVVNGALKQDYTGDYDVVLAKLDFTLNDNLNKMIIAGIVVFVGMLFIGLLFSYYYLLRPMKQLETFLLLATKFKFKEILDKGGYGVTSFVKELGAIHVTFFQMVDRFATAIKENHELVRFSNVSSTEVEASIRKESMTPSIAKPSGPFR
ncbi:hypothetical protein BDR26DRAFT_206270 [Obelidium mucronatum]|nr:hypothetical protein BDR26DRAFT_206270 [Obelidium mucronatum]